MDNDKVDAALNDYLRFLKAAKGNTADPSTFTALQTLRDRIKSEYGQPALDSFNGTLDRLNTNNTGEIGTALARNLNSSALKAAGAPVTGTVHTPIQPAPAEEKVDDTKPAGDGDGGTDLKHAAPTDGLQWLPGAGAPGMPELAAEDVAAIAARDRDLSGADHAHFKVDPKHAWQYDAAQLPTHGAMICRMGDTAKMLEDWLKQVGTATDALYTAWTTKGAASEQELQKQWARLEPVHKALHEALVASNGLPNTIRGVGHSAGEAFEQFRADLRAIREGIQSAAEQVKADGDEKRIPTGSMTAPAIPAAAGDAKSSGQFTSLPGVNQSPPALADVAAKTATISKITGALKAPDVVEKKTAPDPQNKTNPSPSPAPAATTGTPGSRTVMPSTTAPSSPGKTTAPSSPGKTTSPGKKDDGLGDIAKLLASLGSGQQQPAAAQQAASQIPQQAAQAAQQAAQPIKQAASSLPDLLKQLGLSDKADDAAGKDIGGDPANKAADADRAAATTVPLQHLAPASGPAAVGAPGSDARPNQLDAAGKPADKNGDGKVDKDAIPLSKKTVRPFDLSLKTHDGNQQVHDVPDPRLGEMMKNMAAGTPGDPVSVLEAAKESGLPLTSLGDPLDPSQVQVGDAVIGSDDSGESGMYIGDGQVMTSTGDVQPLDQVLGDDGFVSAVPLPELPDDVPADGGAGGADPGAGADPGGNGDGGGQQPAPPIQPVQPAADPGAAQPPAQPVSDTGAPGPAPAGDAGAGPAPAPAPAPAGPSAVGTGSLDAPVGDSKPAPAPSPTPAPAPAPAAQPDSNSDAGAGQSTVPKAVPYEGHALG